MRESRLLSGVAEIPCRTPLEERECLGGNIGNHKGLTAIAEQVSRRNPHAGPRLPVGSVCQPAAEPLLAKHPTAFLRLRAPALVDPKMICRPIVGDQKIRISACSERPGQNTEPGP